MHRNCVRLALSVAVAHERRERHEGARRYDGRLDGSVAVRQIRQRARGKRLALSVAVAHERRERHKGARRYDGRLVGIVAR